MTESINIVVFIKQVPDVPTIRIDEQRMTIIREGVESIINPLDCVALQTALELRKRVNEEIGEVPFVLVLNKTDLRTEWEVNRQVLEELSKSGWTVVETSAKTGEGVEKAFLSLTTRMLHMQPLGQ